MDVMSVSASTFAHGVHYAVVGAGVLVLVVLLGPHVVGRQRPRTAYDEHDRRVLALTEQLATGHFGPLPVSPAAPRKARDRLEGAVLPIAVVSSTAAAGVHAAVGPAHFRELVLFGLFFAASAVAQITWSVAMVLRPSRNLVAAALVGNASVIVLWAVTRTVGLPLGLLPRPEEVGAWDLCCGFWELVVVITCAQLLRRGDPGRLNVPEWLDWRRSAQLFTVGSVAVLGLLTVSGASA